MGRRILMMTMAMALAMTAALPAGANAHPDTTDPTVDVFPADGATVEVGPGDSFVWIVDAFDDSALDELEVDNDMECGGVFPWVDCLPQFTVYADEADPYGGLAAVYASVGAAVTYDFDDQTWVISFGDEFTGYILANGGITFYIEVSDVAGNQFGDMFNVTAEMTFAYTFEYGPYDKDSCKKGGWMNFSDSHGFKNQGKCVAYVNLRDK